MAQRAVLLVACAAAAMSLAMTGCGAVRSSVTTQPDGLRTFTVAKAEGGGPILCNAYKVLPDVVGILRGRQGAAEPAWLEAPDGTRISIVWPEGFTVTFNPQAELHNETGRVVASDGATVELGQVHLGDHKGTPADPYIASGLVLGGCYPYPP
jgi:hypothetical protein